MDGIIDHFHLFREDIRSDIHHIAGGDPLGGPILNVKKGKDVLLHSYFDDTFKPKSCIYEYDFGDSGEHEITRLRIFEDKANDVQKLTGGARAFPFEDCGGLPGYEYYCKLITEKKTSKNTEDYDRIKSNNWDLEHFDFEKMKKVFNNQGIKD